MAHISFPLSSLPNWEEQVRRPKITALSPSSPPAERMHSKTQRHTEIGKGGKESLKGCPLKVRSHCVKPLKKSQQFVHQGKPSHECIWHDLAGPWSPCRSFSPIKTSSLARMSISFLRKPGQVTAQARGAYRGIRPHGEVNRGSVAQYFTFRSRLGDP